MNKQFSTRAVLSVAVGWFLVMGLLPAFAQTFVHPGGLHTQADFDRMKAKVAANASPWVDSYNQLANNALAQTWWPWDPQVQIFRGVSPNNYARSQKDALAIYYNALRWRITGDTNFAEKAVAGCDAWSGTMTQGVWGNSNWALASGICGYEFAIAGEALRGYTNWSQTSISNYCNFLRLFASGPPYGWGNYNYLGAHQGTCDSHYWCNWDACNLASLMAIGVFCDDTNMFNYAVNYMKTGNGNGNLTSAAWYVHTNGLAQWQESGRDQPHAMDGIAWLGVACQVAWNQGVDLYGFDNNRYLRGLEFSAKFNLWQDVPSVPMAVCDNYTGGLSWSGRGTLPPTWDLFYNHYVNLRGLAAPYTAQAAALLRPDGFYNNPNSPDFVGFTTLTCLLDPIAAGAVPGGLTAGIYGTNVLLTWWGSAYATNYLVKRATVSGGPYTTLATISATSERDFFDTTATNGGTYYYAISEQDKFGESPNSPEKKISVGQMVTYYRFNEGSGTNAVDASGLSSSATLMNGATFAAGKFGNSVSLNGSSQYVQLPYGQLAGLSDFTIATWVNLNSIATSARIFDFGADTDRYMCLLAHNGYSPQFSITKFGGGAGQSIYGNATLPTGSWHHIAVTLTGSEGSGVGVMYVDGVAVGTNSSMTYTPDMIGSIYNASNCWVGRSQFAGDPYLNGKVEDFRIYNGALKASQIAALYALTPAVLAAPTNVTASAASANVINLSWAMVNGATNYLVQRSLTSGGPYSVIASGVTAANYTDSGLVGGTTYYYVVAAVNSGGTGSNSVEVSAITLTPPAVPTSLIATGLYGGQIVLSWGASAGVTSYNIKRSLISGGPYLTVASSVTSTAFTNSGLIFNATYYYVVSAVNANGESLNSNETNSLVPVPALVWKGNVNTNWDVNMTTNWLFGGSPSTYFVDGAAVNFDDTATSSSVNVSASVSPYSVTISNAALSYTIGSANGSAIGGSASLTKLGTGTATLTGTNTFTGDISINGGGTLAIGGGGVLGGGNYSGNISSYSTFAYNSSANQTLSGNISLSGAVSKTGAGTLTLTKANDYSGSTTLNSGQLALTGNGGILKSSSILVGNTSGISAAVVQSGSGTLVTPVTGINGLQIGSAAGGFGYYNLSAGSIWLGSEIGIGGGSGGAGTFGQFDLTGGGIVVPNSTSVYFLLNRGGAGESSVFNISSGYVNVAGNGTPANGSWNGLTANWSGSGAGQTNTTTISGTGQIILPSFAFNLNEGGNAANVINLNLNSGGILQVLGFYPSGGASLLNFNGGTLKAGIGAGISGATFLAGLTRATIYSNGATIDDNGQAIAIDQPLLAPLGNGVTSIPVNSGGAGYIMPPRVAITGGGGSNATAYATISSGAVSSIVVTCPGAGYTSVPTVALFGGGYTTPATLGTATIAANVSGGLTKLGTGTLLLSGTNTYSGPTVIGAGTLKLSSPLLYFSFDSTNGTTVINQGAGGMTMNGVLTGTNVSIVSGGHSGKALMVSNGPVNTGYVLINNPVVSFNNSSAWTWGLWIKTSTAGAAYMYQGDGGWVSGNTSFYLNNGSTTGTKGGGVRNSQGWQAGNVSVNDGAWHYIAMTCNNGTKTFYVDGVADSWAVNQWNGYATGGQLWIGGSGDTGDGNMPFNGLIDDVSVFSRALTQPEITNLMAGLKSTSPALPTTANVVVGSGATLLLDTASQTIGSLSGSNSSSVQLAGSSGTAFTFGNTSNTVFSGSITGNGSVAKNGTGTVTLAGVNSYSGATTISTGTVKFGQSDNTNYIVSLGPVLWFNFDQGVDVADGIVTNLGSGGSAMNGVINGNASITNSGRYGSALYLDGASDLEIDNEVTPLDCNATGASWTYALWIKTSTAGATYGYQGDGTWSSAATTFYLNNNGTSAGAKAGGVRYSDGWLTGTATLNNNAWHFIAITVSGGTKTIYVDGNMDAKTGTTGWTQPAMTWANQFLIGSTPDSGDGGVSFNGLIDEVYMFNRALTQSEVQNILSNKTVVATGVTSGQLPAASPVNLASTATLDLAGTTQTFASLSDVSGSGGVVTNSAGTSATLTFSSAGTNTFSGKICDASLANALSLIKSGTGTQNLNGANSYSGNTTVKAGTLAFGQATLPTNGIVTVTNGAVLSLNFSGTNQVAVILLNGVSQSPGIYNAASSAPYLAGTGSLLIATPVATNSPPLAYLYSSGGNSLTFSWPADHTGWRLEAQTNTLSSGLGTNWATVANSSGTNQIVVPIITTNGSVFYRLIYP
jgi:autotransporter-associated beta strand protein